MLNEKQIKALIKKLAKTAYPDYKGRRFFLVERETYQLSNFWDEGSRYYCVAVNLSTGEMSEPSHDSTVPYNQKAHSVITIPPGFGILQRAIVRGNDRGITLYVPPSNRLETSTQEFDALEA